MMARSIFILIVLSIMISTVAQAAEVKYEIKLPSSSIGYIFKVDNSDLSINEVIDRAQYFADIFSIPSSLRGNPEVIENKYNTVAINFVDERERWAYTYYKTSGYENIVNLNKWLVSTGGRQNSLISESQAENIAVKFIGDNFIDNDAIATFRKINVSRVWDESQITPDKEEPIIEKTSNEAVVKVFRQIGDIPIMGPGGYYRIHISNDGEVVGAFSRCHRLIADPIDSVKLPSYEDVLEVAKEEGENRCPENSNCLVKINVAYYEEGHLTEQTILTPMLVVQISAAFDDGTPLARYYALPLPNVVK